MKHIFSLIFILTLLAVPFSPGNAQSRPAPAATIVVDTEVDELDGSPGNGSCALREAITNANNDNADQADCGAGSGADVITLPPGTYTLAGAADEDGNASGDLDIKGDLTINGADAKTTAIQAGTDATNGVDRVMHIFNGYTVEINDVTIRYGKAPDGVDGEDDATCTGGHGGGIYAGSNTTLILNDCVVAYNRSGDGGDGCTSASSFDGQGGRGGGIYIDSGTLTLNATTVRENEAGKGGDGAIGGFARYGGTGGGIYLDQGVATLTGSMVSTNVTGAGGNGNDVTSGTGGAGSYGGSGGGIYNFFGDLTLVESTVTGNTTGAGGDGGDSASGAGGDGRASGHGAGIYNSYGTMVAVQSAIYDNATGPGGSGGSGTSSNGADGWRGSGGGIGSSGSVADTMLDGCTLRDNEAQGGGGLYNESGGTVTLDGCTLSSNTATDNDGGGIYNGSGSIVALTNSTVSGNGASRYGGGIYSAATMTLNHVTVAYNTADADTDGSGDGGGIAAFGAFTMTNTLVAKNFDNTGEDPDCHGTTISGDYNLLGIGDSSGCTFSPQPHDQVGTVASPIDPLLGVLGDNGGPTLTHVFKSNSPAVDVIPPASCPLLYDQRGFSRPVDYDGDGTAECDVGAVEIRENYLLTVGVEGTGQGGVLSTPSGIDCEKDGGNCSEFFDINTVVTLTASTGPTSTFTGWSGDCSGMDPTCAVTMDMNHSVTATFDLLPTYTLSISLLGDGTGNVSSEPAGIDCGEGGTDCTVDINLGTVVTLTATSTSDSSFAGWTGDASGMDNPLVITVDGNKSIEANFTENTADWLIYLPIITRE